MTHDTNSLFYDYDFGIAMGTHGMWNLTLEELTIELDIVLLNET